MPKDGWDLAILIRLKIWNRLSFDRVMGQVISEIGWLKGGDDELVERLNGLIEERMIVRECNNLYPDSPTEDYYIITQKGRDYIHG